MAWNISASNFSLPPNQHQVAATNQPAVFFSPISAITHEPCAEKTYRISGTDRSFSSNTIDFDDKAVEEIMQINLLRPTRRDAVEMYKDFLDLEPEHTGDRLFLCQHPYDLSYGDIMQHTDTGKWKRQGLVFGYGVGNSRMGFYRGLKQSYVYHKGDRKTNWIMNTYSPITGDSIKADSILLCHVFQSDGSYDPLPKRISTIFDDQSTRKYLESLEYLLQDPNTFKDSDEFHENSGAYSAPKANGSKGKRSAVWEDFTEIKVLGPNGEVVLTLAICHHCSVAYKTGGLKPKRKDSTELVFRNNGTKTLEEHKGRCSGHQHTAGNPQGGLH